MLSLVALVVVTLANVALGAVVLMNNTRGRLNQVFGSLAFVLAGWGMVTYFEDVIAARHTLWLLARLDFSLAAVMLLLFYWFCLEMTSGRGRILLWLGQGLTAASVALSLAGLTVTPQLQ